MSAAGKVEHVALECLVCACPCTILGVFSECGHFVCFSCALRIHVINEKGCPICRLSTSTILITRKTPKSEDGFDMATELKELKEGRGTAVKDSRLKCIIEDALLAAHVRKLYEFLCPVPACWHHGHQDPFVEESMLREHLKYDHALRYCLICISHRPAFLSEQIVYTEQEYDQHLQAHCSLDTDSFQGHPPCKFCGKERFYDGEYLLKHMQHNHFSCDLCNRGEFTFTYYKNRDKLLEHFQSAHKLCDHPDCQHLDPMLRVFQSDLDLQAHKQKAHGAGNRGIALDALGFRFSYGGGSVSEAIASSATGGSSSLAPATGANSHALKIVFDYVSRREEVNTMPKMSVDSRGGGGKRGGKQQQQQQQQHTEHIRQSERHEGLPPHFVDPTLKLIQMMMPSTPQVAAAVTRPHASSKPSWRTGGSDGDGCPTVSHDGKITGGRAPAACSTLSKEEQNKLFDEKLRQYITNPKRLGEFRYACGDYLSGKLLAKEYYSMLQSTFFPDAQALNDIFPVLVATMPNSSKSEALTHIRQMMNAPEMQRQQRAQEEDVATSAMRQAVHHVLNKNKPKAAAWGGKAAPASARPSGATPSLSSPPTSSAPTWSVRPSSNQTQQAPSAVSPVAHVDPGAFPDLPLGGSGSHKSRTNQPVKPPQRNNVWFKK